MRPVRRPLAIKFGLLTIAVAALVSIGVAAASFASDADVVPTFALGRQTIYRLGYQGESVDQPAAVFGATTPRSHVQRVFTTVRGILTETVVARDAHSATMLVEIVQPKISFSARAGLTDALYESKLASDLRESYALRVDANGRIERIAPPADASALGLGFVRTIAGDVMVVAPSHASRFQRQWESDEPDVDGERHGSYALDRWISDPLSSASVAFRRTTNVTSDIASGDGIRRPTTVTLGNDSGVWRLDGVLETLHARATRSVAFGRDPIARSQTRIDVQLIATTSLGDDRLAVARSYADARLASRNATTLAIARDARKDTAASYVASLGSDTEDTLETRLIDAARKGAAAQRPALVAKFAALFYEQPRSIADFLPIARGADASSMVFAVLLPALAQAATGPAQDALIALAKTRANDPRAGRLVAIALGLLPEPADRVDDALEGIVCCGRPEAAQSAEFALGSIADHVRDREPARSARIVARIERRLHDARSDGARNTELLALGNAADPQSYAALSPFVRAPAAPLRGAAATALRNVSGALAEAVLRTLLTDRDDYVRLAATSAFADRTTSDAGFDALVAVSRNDPSAPVRSAAVTSLWNARAAHADAPEIVRSIADSDSDASVRTAAHNALAASTAPNSQDLVTATTTGH